MTYFEFEKNFFIESSQKLILHYTFFKIYGNQGDSSAIKKYNFSINYSFLEYTISSINLMMTDPPISLSVKRIHSFVRSIHKTEASLCSLMDLIVECRRCASSLCYSTNWREHLTLLLEEQGCLSSSDLRQSIVYSYKDHELFLIVCHRGLPLLLFSLMGSPVVQYNRYTAL